MWGAFGPESDRDWTFPRNGIGPLLFEVGCIPRRQGCGRMQSKRLTCDPTPTGMWSKSACASSSFNGSTSLSVRLVLTRRTPQLMSKPTPPERNLAARE